MGGDTAIGGGLHLATPIACAENSPLQTEEMALDGLWRGGNFCKAVRGAASLGRTKDGAEAARQPT